MKKIIAFVFLSLGSFLHAQVQYYANKSYVKSIIELNTGEKLEGLTKDFNQPEGFIVESMVNFGDLEDQLKVSGSQLSFKKDDNSPEQKIAIQSIKRIEFLGELDSNVFEHIKVKTIKKGVIQNHYRDLFVPLIREGKINVYGTFVAMKQGGENRVVLLLNYIKNPKDEFAYAPVDFESVSLFSFNNSLQEGYITAIEEVGRDCPAFVTQTKSEIGNLFSNEAKKKAIEEYFTVQASIKEAVKKVKTREEKERIANEYQMNYLIRPYLELFKSYETLCP